MLERSIAFLAAQVVALALVSAAWSQETPDASPPEMPKDYLAGTWGIGDAEACGAATTELITFDADGTFGATLDSQPTAVGFWHLVDDHLDLHMVSSPAFFDDQLQAFAGQYTYYYAKALLFDIEDQTFRMVANMGNLMRGANLVRCP